MMNMVNGGVKAELIKLAYDLQNTSALFGAAYKGEGTAVFQKKEMEKALERLTNLVDKL